MFPVKNDINSTNILYTGSHKNFPIHYGLRGKLLKCILTYLYCTKYNEINMCYSDVQNNINILCGCLCTQTINRI